VSMTASRVPSQAPRRHATRDPRGGAARLLRWLGPRCHWVLLGYVALEVLARLPAFSSTMTGRVIGVLDDLLILGLAVLAVAARAYRHLPTMFRFGALLFVVMGVVSGLVNTVPWQVLVEGTWLAAKLPLAVLGAMAVARHGSPDAFVRSLTYAMLGVAAVAAAEVLEPRAVHAVFGESGALHQGGVTAVKSVFAHPGPFAFFAVTGLAVAIGAARTDPVLRYTLLATSGLLVLGGGRLKGVIGLAVVVAVAVVIRRHTRLTRSQVLLVAIPGAAICVAFLATGLPQEKIERLLNEENPAARMLLYHTGMAIAVDESPFGAGFGRFGTHTSRVHTSPLYAEYGLSIRHGFRPQNPAFVTDASWAGILGETGVAGTIGAGLMILAFPLLLPSVPRRRRAAAATLLCLVAVSAVDGLASARMFDGYAGLLIGAYLGWATTARTPPRRRGATALALARSAAPAAAATSTRWTRAGEATAAVPPRTLDAWFEEDLGPEVRLETDRDPRAPTAEATDPPARGADAPRAGRTAGFRAAGVRVLRAAMAVGAAGVLVGAVAVLTAGNLLVDARSDAEEGRDLLLAGELDAAAARFSRSADAFGRAHRRLDGPSTAALRIAPVVGGNLAAVGALAHAGEILARAGVAASAAGMDHDALSLLSPARGVIPVQAIRDLQPLAEQLHEEVVTAEQLVAELDTHGLVRPVVTARRQLLEQLDLLLPATGSAAALADALPAFLGLDGPRRYFVGAASPAELRGSGGLVGAYTIMEAREGALSFGKFQPILSLGDADPGDVEAVDPSLHERYGRFGGATHWRSITMTPDFPSAATAIERLYEHATGEPVDGVIIVTPQAFASLMEVTGPVDVIGYGQLPPEDAVEALGNEAYAEITNTVERKHLLGAAALEVFLRFVSGEADDPVRAARILGRIVAGGDLLLHAAAPEVQAAFEEAGIAGALLPAAGEDLLAVVGNNAAGNKVDFYMSRSLDYNVSVEAANEVVGVATVRLRNDAPTEGLPPHIIGPHWRTSLEPGGNVTLLSAYCAPQCELRHFSQDGQERSVVEEVELGLPVFWSRVELPSGAETELRFGWSNPAGWTGDARRGRYRLRIAEQATIHATRVRVSVTLPDGVDVTYASAGVRVEGGIARWEGEPRGRQAVEIEWRSR
jgi:hypothetical protein